MTASILSALAGVELGAFGVVAETFLSGVTQLPFSVFAALMLPIHLAIGLVEGITTGLILAFYINTVPNCLRKTAATPNRKPASDWGWPR